MSETSDPPSHFKIYYVKRELKTGRRYDEGLPCGGGLLTLLGNLRRVSFPDSLRT